MQIPSRLLIILKESNISTRFELATQQASVILPTLQANRETVPASGGTVGPPDVTTTLGLLVVVVSLVVVVVLTVVGTVTTSGIGVTNLRQHNEV